MIAAVIVCAAVIAQAGAVKWNWNAALQNGWKNTGTSGTYTGKGAQAGTMYIFNLNDTYGEEGKNITQQYILTSVLAGSALSSLGAMDSYDTANGTMAVTSAKTLVDDHTEFNDRVDGATHYADYFYAMLVKDSDTGHEWLYLSEDFHSIVYQTSQNTPLAGAVYNNSQFNRGDTTTFVNGGWYAAAPEPTSGLLLLLGVAGLALRRRRA